jgi:hypothetical protein
MTEVRPLSSRHAGRLLAAMPLLIVAGCGRTMTDDDCRRVADHMRDVWSSEAKKAAPSDTEGAAKAEAIIRSEGESLVQDWAAECKKELQGRRVDPKEMDCLLKTKTVEEINQCAEL